MRARRVVLVTGAGGFIGRWSIAPLLRAGYEVHAVLSGKANREVPAELAGSAWHFADLLAEADIDALIMGVKPSHLLHFAWIATPGLYWSSAENFRWLAASRHLLRCFAEHGGERVLMAGSCAEYDWTRGGVCDERSSALADTAGAALSAYAECKIALQRELADFGRERLTSAWGRIFFQFGPHEHPDRLVPSVIRNLLLNRAAPCSQGTQIRSFLHVADVGAAFAAVLDSTLEGPVNIGSGERIAVAELIDRIARQIGRPELIQLGARPAATNEPGLLVPEVHRLVEEAKWRPRYTLNAGLRDTIAWWRGRLQGTATLEYR